MKNIMSGVDKQISDYNESFKALQYSLSLQSTIHCTVTVFRVFDSVKQMDQKVDEIRSFFLLVPSLSFVISHARCDLQRHSKSWTR